MKILDVLDAVTFSTQHLNGSPGPSVPRSKQSCSWTRASSGHVLMTREQFCKFQNHILFYVSIITSSTLNTILYTVKSPSTYKPSP